MHESVLFIGAGTMGYPMIARLCRAGYPVAVADADHVAASRAAAGTGARVAVPSDAADADIVILMLPSSSAVAAVVGTDDKVEGLRTSLRRGSIVIDMGSSDPRRTRQLSSQLADGGIVLIDAPVSGGPRRAESGELTIMVGTDDIDSVDKITGVLNTLGKTVIRTGPTGSAHALKALNNLLSVVGLVAALECLTIGKSFGLDPRVMLDVLNASTGRNHATEVKIGPQVLEGGWNVGFSMGLTMKDVATALSVAEDVGVSAAVSEAAVNVARRALDMCGPAADQSEIARLLEKESGVELG